VQDPIGHEDSSAGLPEDAKFVPGWGIIIDPPSMQEPGNPETHRRQRRRVRNPRELGDPLTGAAGRENSGKPGGLNLASGGCRSQGNLRTHRRRDWKRINGATRRLYARSAEGWRSEATRSSIAGKLEDAGVRQPEDSSSARLEAD